MLHGMGGGKREGVLRLPLCETMRGDRPLRGAVRTGASSIRCLASAPQPLLSHSKAAWPVTVSRCGHGASWTGVVCQAVVPDAPTNVGGLFASRGQVSRQWGVEVFKH